MGESRNRSKRKTGGATPGLPRKVSVSAVNDADFLESAKAANLLDGITDGEQREMRLTSVRAYRRLVDRALHWTLLGRTNTAFLKEIVVAAREGASLLMTEKLLDAKGLTDDEPVHLKGPDGGAVLPSQPPKEPRKVMVERTVGTGANGTPTDMTTVTIEGGEELAGEVAALSGGISEPAQAALPPQPAPVGMAARLAATRPRDPFLDPGEVDPGEVDPCLNPGEVDDDDAT